MDRTSLTKEELRLEASVSPGHSAEVGNRDVARPLTVEQGKRLGDLLGRIAVENPANPRKKRFEGCGRT